MIIAPHAAYYFEEARRTFREFAAQEVVRVLNGHTALRLSTPDDVPYPEHGAPARGRSSGPP